ncbi:LuxR family transcriptional regulator [Lentzea alba]|uniref:LuxR C-terminal-related transcriptional regulator n=1 Tax=Lentzea alba TaxID=2714351 RepID=UPI0039BED776
MVVPRHSLVGREREVAALTEALGSGVGSCLVHGAAGMGKSALLSVASSIAVRSGLRPVRGLGPGTLLVVDDVEQLSADEIERLSRFEGAVLLAGDVDPVSPPEGLADLLADAVRVPLRPIGSDAVAEMVRRRFDVDSPELAGLLLAYSGGAPGVVSDVLDLVTSADCLRDRLSGLRLPRLLRAVRRYWQGLDAEAVAVARALAVLGEAPLDLLGEVAGMGSFQALAAFERLVDARLAVDQPMRLRSPALGHAIRHEAAPEARERLHRTAAEVMYRRCDPVTAVAEHVVACARPVGAQWVAPVLGAAARLHRAAGRPEHAVRCLRAALREPMSGETAAQVAEGMADLHLRWGIAPHADELTRLWRWVPDAADLLAAVVVEWQCDEDVLGALGGDVGVGDWPVAEEMWARRGDHAEVSRLMQDLAGDSPLRGCVALGAAAFVASCVDSGRPDEAREMLVRLGYLGTLPPAPVCTVLLHQRARMHLALGSPRAALADAERAGAAEVAEQARIALQVPRKPVRGAAWGKLTPHEARIVRLVLEGETNRAIATRFNVTQRAVELHLTRVYRKAGICRRVQLSAVFGAI